MSPKHESSSQNNKETVKTVIFTPTSFFESSYDPSSDKKPDCIKERVVSFENMDELKRKVFDLYRTETSGEECDHDENTQTNRPKRHQMHHHSCVSNREETTQNENDDDRDEADQLFFCSSAQDRGRQLAVISHEDELSAFSH